MRRDTEAFQRDQKLLTRVRGASNPEFPRGLIPTNLFALSITAICIAMLLYSCNENSNHNSNFSTRGDTLDAIPFSDSTYNRVIDHVNNAVDRRLSLYKASPKKYNKEFRILAWMNASQEATTRNGIFVLTWVHMKDSLSNNLWCLSLISQWCDSNGCQEWNISSPVSATYVYDSATIAAKNDPNLHISDSVMSIIWNASPSRTLISRIPVTSKMIVEFTEDELRLASPFLGFITPMVDWSIEPKMAAKTTIRERTWQSVTGDDPNVIIPALRAEQYVTLIHSLNNVNR